MIGTYLKAAGERIAAPWLDKPTPASLEFLAAEGEREIKKLDDKTYFVYELLTASQKKYESRREGISVVHFGNPRLPQSVNQPERTSHLRGKLRKILRPEEYTALEQERCNPSLDTALKTAYREAGFREEVHGVSIAGIDEDRLHTLLYVPATNAGEADSKVQEYRRKINDLLQPRRLSCDYKIKPVMKKD